ncbi:MAG: CocE/NonD family hydrolase [Parachlamydiaceae bacterium]|nr:CocE/NonD family hydrolase [Parachlamydiaceae bacterium]
MFKHYFNGYFSCLIFLLCFWTYAFTGVHAFVAEEITPDQTVMIKMKDGTQLPTDLYLPNLEAKNLPCILLRSPAGRFCRTATPVAAFAKLGYLVAIQDTRSAIDLEGKTLPYTADNWLDEQDGHETLQWLAKSPLTNGKIGTMGFSAMGITQQLMAPFAPDSLKCQYIGTAPASLFHHAIFPSGVFLKHQVETWLGYYAKDPGVCSFVANQYLNDRFWLSFDVRNVAQNVTSPAIHQAGWYDTFLQGSIEGFLARQEHGGDGAKGQQKLIIGPWTHFWPLSSKLGDFEVPEAGKVVPFEMGPYKLFEYYLKGIDNGVDKFPAVFYYVMGPFDGTPSKGNIWKFADKWPVDSIQTSYYLAENKSLSLEKPATDAKMSYRYDPTNLVPTLGGLNLFLDAGPIDQRPIESRDDVLVFSTEPLDRDTEITGRIMAKIFLSPHVDGATIAMRLSDVYPDGRSLIVGDGIYRKGKNLKTSQAIDPSKPAEIDVDLWSTSMVFAKGHRIRISISGSNYPRYEDAKVGALTNIIHLGKNYPSRIILPVVPAT